MGCIKNELLIIIVAGLVTSNPVLSVLHLSLTFPHVSGFFQPYLSNGSAVCEPNQQARFFNG
jgi:hypothetical protein